MFSVSQVFEENNMSGIDASLTIISVKESYYGAFTCRASNIYGISEETVVLYGNTLLFCYLFYKRLYYKSNLVVL